MNNTARAGEWLGRHRTRLPQADPAQLADTRLLWAIEKFLQIQTSRSSGTVVFSFRDGIPVSCQPQFMEYPPKVS